MFLILSFILRRRRGSQSIIIIIVVSTVCLKPWIRALDTLSETIIIPDTPLFSLLIILLLVLFPDLISLTVLRSGIKFPIVVVVLPNHNHLYISLACYSFPSLIFFLHHKMVTTTNHHHYLYRLQDVYMHAWSSFRVSIYFQSWRLWSSATHTTWSSKSFISRWGQKMRETTVFKLNHARGLINFNDSESCSERKAAWIFKTTSKFHEKFKRIN